MVKKKSVKKKIKRVVSNKKDSSVNKKLESKVSNLLIKKEKKIPDKIERVSSGIGNFDKLVQGGFEKNATNLVVGSSGSGKSIFAVHFLMQGLRKGEKCLYITFEEKKEVFFMNMKQFGFDLEQEEKKGKFVFLEYTPEKVKTMLEEGGGVIESIVLREGVSRIVIDSITSFELLFDDDLKKREAALELFGMLRKWNTTTLLTYEEDPTKDGKASSKALEFESDSIIVLYFVRTGKKRERFLEIIKMRGTEHSREIFPFDIKKKGIEVSTRAYSGKLDIE